MRCFNGVAFLVAGDFFGGVCLCLLGRFDVRVCPSGSLASLHPYSEPQKIKALLVCIHYVGRFLIQHEIQVIENHLYSLQNPTGVSSA